MDIAVGATIVSVAKGLLTLLFGDEKGRKFLLYAIGIALFLVCIPLITLLGLFGWMAGSGEGILNQENILGSLTDDQLAQMQAMDEVVGRIVTTFEAMGLEKAEQEKAVAIYMDHLVGLEKQDGFYEKLANCYLGTTEDADVYDLVSQTFSVIISEEDQRKYDSLYGTDREEQK